MYCAYDSYHYKSISLVHGPHAFSAKRNKLYTTVMPQESEIKKMCQYEVRFVKKIKKKQNKENHRL